LFRREEEVKLAASAAGKQTVNFPQAADRLSNDGPATTKSKETAMFGQTSRQMPRLFPFSRVVTAALLSLPVLVLPIRGQAQAPAPVAADGVTDRVVTVYAGGFGQVWERRPLTAGAGPRDIVLDGISRQALAESLDLSGDGGPVTVRSVTLSNKLLTPAALLERFVGREIGVVKVHPTTGEERTQKATVLSATGGVVLRIGRRIETGQPGRLVFPDDVGGLSARPRLTAAIDASASAKGLTLTYLTDGLGWQADYAARLSPDGKMLGLTGWASVANDTGVDLDAGRLRLVAGQVDRAAVARPMLKAAPMMAEARGMASDAALPQRRAEGGMQVYTLAAPVKLAAGERRQIALLGPVEVPVANLLILSGHPPVFGAQRGALPAQHPERRLRFENKSLVPGGLPIPAGAVRVYRAGADGVPLFAGADTLSDTPDGATAEISLGTDFDVTATREQTAFKRLDAQGRTVETSFRIEVMNGGDAAKTVRLDENLPGDWTVVAKSQAFERAGGQARFTVQVPAKGKTEVTYTVRVLR
jgi:hypothetical protein